MRIYEHFPYTGGEDRWIVPEGVTSATFECWGASGGMPSHLEHYGKKNQVVGGDGPRNIFFTNRPGLEGQLGISYPNNAGYVSGVRTVNAGEVYYVLVGGNGRPGHSSIKLHTNGTTVTVGTRGGAGGWNGGGNGGPGALTSQNLYNAVSFKVHYKKSTMPNAAKVNQLWWDTSVNVIKKCNTTYTAGNGTAAKWDRITNFHPRSVGPSGGGGGGATDIRFNGDDPTNRVMVAGGGGGAGGHWIKTGSAAWVLRPCLATPAPPFGADTQGTGASGADSTWNAAVNYLVGGWGGGGLGGANGTEGGTQPTTDGGQASAAGQGGPATDRHVEGVAPKGKPGSAGQGGSAVAGGAAGNGGNSTAGSLGQGGQGSTAVGGNDDWCAGGGGGGGGYYGGGGGGQGFRVAGKNAQIGTRGAGGGGGSNYVGPGFTSPVLLGGARPPAAVGNASTGANGRGGFARIAYNKPPVVKWKAVPNATLGGATYTVTFRYIPAQTDGSPINYYVFGTSATTTDTFPTSQTTVMVADNTQTEFTVTFTAPAAGSSNAIFIKAVDEDGDSSAWLKNIVTGLTAAQNTAATITAPAANAQFVNSATVTWTPGNQTPEALYRVGITGTDLVTGATRTALSDWKRGGSRVNLALDPGFKASSGAVWQSTANVAMVTATTAPGVSGSNGTINWNLTDNGDAENHTIVLNNLRPGRKYRWTMNVTSSLSHDPRPVILQVWDGDGLLAETTVDLSNISSGNVYVPATLVFTPHTQGVYFVIVPTASSVANVDPLLNIDFEDNTTNGIAASAGATVAVSSTLQNSGTYSLNIGGFVNGGAATKDITSQLTAAGGGAGWYLASAMVYAPTASDRDASLQMSGAGITYNGAVTVKNTTRNAFVPVRTPFYWNGSGQVIINFFTDIAAAHGGHNYDDVCIYDMDVLGLDSSQVGNVDSSQINRFSDMIVEAVTANDAAGYGSYFDGTNLNGNTGTVSWSGTANASPSYLTGTDVTTDTVAFAGPLKSASVLLDIVTTTALNLGTDYIRATQAVNANPSLPATPTVTMTVDNPNGQIVLSVNAADGAATNKTVSIDVFRNGVRIATGLTPDQTTRVSTFYDFPAFGVSSTYVIRAYDSAGGYADATTGTVSVLS